jgi:hypothetical protein
MATLEQLSAALVKADAAGNAEDAKAFADAIRQMRAPAEGMPSERKMSMGEAFMQVPAGIYKGFKDVTDTMFKGGASAVDFLAGTKTRAAVDEAAARANAEYQATYGGSTLAQGGQILGNVLATAPVGAVIAAPFKMAAGSRALASGNASDAALARSLGSVGETIASGGFRTGVAPTAGRAGLTGAQRGLDLGLRAGGGAITGAASAGLVNPEDVETGAIIGAAVPTVAAPVIKGAAKFLGYGKDVVTGRAAEVRVGEVMRQALGDQLIPATEALGRARPGITAVQALKEAGITSDPFMALGKMAESIDTKSAYRLLREAQEGAMQNQLALAAGGATQTAAREAQVGAKNALTAATMPIKDINLQAANQAGQTISQLGPRVAQKEASMVSALQGQGQAATNAAQQANLARGGVIPESLGGTGVPQPVSGVVPGMPRLSPSITLNAERAAESGALSGEMGAIKAQRQAERDFMQRQIGSLEAYGLKPLDVTPIINTIDSKLTDPNLFGQTQLLRILQGLKDDFAGAVAANGGVADARALYSIRKAGINQKIDEMFGSMDPAAKQRLTADVLSSIKNPIDEAIIKAGGTGWKNYLQTFETGMQKIDQQKLAALALEKFKGSKEEFLKLVRGDNPDAVEKIFGLGSFNIVKEMDPLELYKMSRVASKVERDIGIEKEAAAGAKGLARIMGMSESQINGIPAFFSTTTTTINMALKILRSKISQDTYNVIEKSMMNGRSAADIIQTLPSKERNAVLRTLMNSRQWNPEAITAPTQIAIDRQNNLAPENRNSLRP